MLFNMTYINVRASLVAQLVKNPAMQETLVKSLDQEHLLEEGMANHSCILACKITWTEQIGRLQSWGRRELGD